MKKRKTKKLRSVPLTVHEPAPIFFTHNHIMNLERQLDRKWATLTVGFKLDVLGRTL